MTRDESNKKHLRKMLDMIQSVDSQQRLSEIIEIELSNRDEYENARGETYMETAERVRESKPELASFMDAAESRWFELGD